VGGYVGGRYAGYFAGDVKVTGTINGVTISTASDSRYKKNVVKLESKKGMTLTNILSFNPVEYNLQQVYLKAEVSDTSTVSRKAFDENSQQFQRKHYGLIAQEVKNIYPDLVYEDSDGYLGINYIGIIPLLVESMKELKAEIDVLKGGKLISSDFEELRSATGTTIVQNEPAAALYQNAPNPFSAETQIRYHLPSSVHTACLCVYDLQGKQLKQYMITHRGEGVHVITRAEFLPGIYLYGLIADGTEVDVKRMILTE
jgi:hypothetical protein